MNDVDFEQIVENSPCISMRLFYEGALWKTLYISENVEKYGFNSDDFMHGRLNWNDMLHPDDRVLAVNLAHEYMTKKLDDFRLQYRILTPNKESFFITEYSHVNRNADGEVENIDSYLLNTTAAQANKDIADRHNMQNAIFNEILVNLQEADLDVAIQVILDRAGAYLDCSRALLFKDSPDHKTCKVVYEWLNQGITSIMELDYAVTYATEMPEIYIALQKTGMLLVDAGAIPDNCREEFEKEGLVSSAIFAVYRNGDHYGFVCFDDCIIHRTWDEDAADFLKNISNLLSTTLTRMSNERQIRIQENSIREMAYLDNLTKLPNRYRCDMVLSDRLRNAGTDNSSGYALFIDLDDFKIVNDCYGHDYGDGVLVGFANYLTELLDRDDAVFRFGGDEFIVVVDNVGEAGLRKLLDAMIERAKRPWQSLGNQFYCSLSIGVVEYPLHGNDAKSIIKKADIAMYQAKKRGKNQYVFYAEGLDSDSINRTEMEAMLRRAIENDFEGVVVHFQPYSDCRSGKVLGAEALIRIRAPSGELLLPKHFLSLAEYLGLIVPLGEFILARAAEQCRKINESGFPDFKVTVNLSAKQFNQKNIAVRLDEILDASGVNPANVIISINEKVAIDELGKMERLCAILREKGVGIALNDFGSGSAAFINMRQLPVDMIKISSKYVEDTEDRFTGYFLKLVTELAHFTGKKVCMNGVETERQYQFCREYEVDMVQGFLFHPPGDIDRLRTLLGPWFTRVFYRGKGGAS